MLRLLIVLLTGWAVAAQAAPATPAPPNAAPAKAAPAKTAPAAPTPGETTPAASETPATATPASTANINSAAAKITFSQCHVDGQYIAMTFDDGPHAANTPRLLDMLKQRKIHATFFVIGQNVAEYPDIMKRIKDEGHEIGSHSWSHPQLSVMSEAGVKDQLQKTHDAIIQTTGITPTLMRPPYGAFTARQRAWAHSVWGYKIILWDVDPLDWKVRNAEHVKNEILRQTVPGSIILSHDIHKSTIDAMPETLDTLLGKGYKFVTVSELIAMDRPVVPKPKATPAAKTDAVPATPGTPAAETTPSTKTPPAPAPVTAPSAKP
jgi:peptidoglycan/xylan/chitin deacetylase (PgdA/CDA1 family)